MCGKIHLNTPLHSAQICLKKPFVFPKWNPLKYCIHETLILILQLCRWRNLLTTSVWCVCVCVVYVCQGILHLLCRVYRVRVSRHFVFSVSCVSCTCVNAFCIYCVVCVVYVYQGILHLVCRVCRVRVSMHFAFTVSCVSCTYVKAFCI